MRTHMRGAIAGGAVLILMLARAVAGDAQTRATVLLKSGDRVTGEFEDIQNGQIYMRLSRDEERRIPIDDALVIDLDGTARELPRDEVARAAGPGDVLVLRDGTIWPGRLEDIYREGETGDRTIAGAKVEVVFRDGDEPRRIALSRVVRLYLADTDLTSYPGAVAQAPAPEPSSATGAAASSVAPGQPGSVPATSQWTPTGVVVAVGELVTFRASGEVVVGPNEVASADGSRAERRDPSAPLPNVLAGALIGRVGNGPPFGIGSQTIPLRMPGAGELFVGINEGVAGLGDNSGAFTVTISK